VRGETGKGKCLVCGEEEDPVQCRTVMLKFFNLRSGVKFILKINRLHFYNEVAMIKTANIRNKESLKKMGECLFKIFERRRRVMDKL
jgi:hypothetical protein